MDGFKGFNDEDNAVDNIEVFLDELLEKQAIRLRRHTALSVRTDIHPTYVVRGSAALAQMVNALVDNAARRASSTIEMTLYRRDAQAVIIVADDGPDVQAGNSASPAAENPYATGSSAGDPTDLDFVALIAAGHRGTVTVGDRVGGGAEVVVTLPSSRQR